jgi:hypothetical protein
MGAGGFAQLIKLETSEGWNQPLIRTTLSEHVGVSAGIIK